MTDIIELTAEEKLQMNDVVGELHIQLEKLRSMIMKPYDHTDAKIGALAEIIKEDLDLRIVSKTINKGYERHPEKNTVSKSKFDRMIRRTRRKRRNSL